MRGKFIFTAAVAAAGLATALAAPALAQDANEIFISALDSEGIPYSSADNAIQLAGAVCEYAAAGQDKTQIALEIMGPAGWSPEQSGFFVGAATQSYCP
ncbi:DUF732 domain-containing protein [Mycobacterium sp. 236(2023)]|uniref:DUF732 domain-containing protein n=1 Tax=Mycobacterium sp. 236(2023) TaxID=3038163 RepID=UPI002414ECFA|nr:DUF732 domain-containing protein [Mycobacterium sp. 236(2023)]MDG4665969.1 DUF732 domain-containing protein [Mycobacterium sp. 236(2023)]